MPKTIKEVYTDYTGYTTVEYSDDSTRKYSVDDVPTVSTNPLTGENTLLAGGKTYGLLPSAGVVAQRDVVSASKGKLLTNWAGAPTAQNARDYVNAVIRTGGIGSNYHHAITASNGVVLAAYLDELRKRSQEGACDVVTAKELADYISASKSMTTAVIY